MLFARRSFLERGHYRPLAAAIGALVIQHRAEMVRSGIRIDRYGILDVGCGEGYYLDRLQTHIKDHDPLYLGMDIAKDAVRLAAKRRRDMHFVVADINAPLPFADRSIAALLNIFAPHHPRDFARILAPTGILIVVIPTPNHVSHLRTALPLLGIEDEKQQRTIARFSGFFETAAVTTIEYETVLSNAELCDLVRMTPSGRHLTAAMIDRMAKMESIRTAVGFDILMFRTMQR
jgi:23S rRNA (guanine745-N1)-methyltransferase